MIIQFSGEMGTKHTVLNEEQAAFADWINNNLDKDKDVVHKLKLNVRVKRLKYFCLNFLISGRRV